MENHCDRPTKMKGTGDFLLGKSLFIRYSIFELPEKGKLVHNHPMQLKRLILRLDSSNVQFFVHVDMKADIKQFEDVIQLHNVHFIQNRVKVYWGSYNIVQATLNGFEAIIQSAIEFDYITLLSGQDYPLTNNQAIQAFFKNNPGKAFMEFYPFETEWKEAIPRIHKYHLTNFPFSGSSKIEYLMNKLYTFKRISSSIKMSKDSLSSPGGLMNLFFKLFYSIPR